jgi:hypothetical protein
VDEGERRKPSLVNNNMITSPNLMEMLLGLSDIERRGKT